MESWPRMERMTETFGATVGRALLESFYATASTEGLSVIFNRCALMMSIPLDPGIQSNYHLLYIKFVLLTNPVNALTPRL